MNFTKALELLKEGKRLKLKGWGKDSYIKLHHNKVDFDDEDGSTHYLDLEEIESNEWEVHRTSFKLW